MMMKIIVVGTLLVVFLANSVGSAYPVNLVTTAQEQNATFQALPKFYGCEARTHRPHKSSHVPTNVNVIGESYCKKVMLEIGVEIILYKGRWCIPRTVICIFWDPYGPAGLDIQYNSKNARANSAGLCETGAYMGVSVHWVLAPHDGQYYYASTWNKAWVQC